MSTALEWRLIQSTTWLPKAPAALSAPVMMNPDKTFLGRCRLIQFPVRGDDRGQLVPIEGGLTIPIEVRRVYTVFGTKPGVSRGFHAHHQISQVVVAVSGSCTMVLDDGKDRVKTRLDRPDVGLTIPPMIWHEMEDFTPDCVLMVLADAPYDEADYIRDYERFRAIQMERAG